MKHTLTILVAAFISMAIASCGEGGVCSCRFANPPARDTDYNMGRNVTLSDLQPKCRAIQQQNPAYDTCIGMELKD